MLTPDVRVTPLGSRGKMHTIRVEIRGITSTAANTAAKALRAVGKIGRITTPTKEVYRISIEVECTLLCDAISATTGALGPHTFRNIPEPA